jgi:hypothetical protein
MRFRGTVKDARLSSKGINIHLLASDDCSTDDLRAYFDELVMVNIEIVAPEAEVVQDAFELDGELD